MKAIKKNHEKTGGCFKYLIWGIVAFGLFQFFPIIMNYGVKGLIYIVLLGSPLVLIFYGINYLVKKKTGTDLIPIIKSYLPSFGAMGKSRTGTGNALNFTINGKTTIKNPFAGIFISGGAGSGKSKSLIEPLIKESGKKNFTGVVYDFKFPELAQYVHTAYSNSEVKPYYFNFQDISRSHRLNPIAPNLMSNDSFAREFAYSILANLNPAMISKPDFWSDNSVAFLTAIFWYLKTKHPKKCTLPHAISLIMQPDFDALFKEIVSVPKCQDMIAPLATAYANGAKDQFAGVLSSLQVSLSKINVDEIYYLMTESEVNLELNNEENKGVLVLGNNPVLATTYAPIMGLVLTSVSKQLNRAGKEKSVFMIDEFPTVYVPNVEQLPATARSNKVATILACQYIAQVQDKYGSEKTESILSNLGNQFYGRTPSIDTARRVVALFGKYDKQKVSISSKEILEGNSVTKSTQESDFVKPQDVANLNTGTFYTVLSEGNNRQGISAIPMDKNFHKTEIEPFSNVTESDIENAYNKVKNDISDMLMG